jgi:hypothetical protein
MQAKFEVFRSSFSSWEALFAEASEFASRLGPERLISISHSEDQNTGVVVVWYWSQDSDHCANCGHDLTGNVSGVCPECGERL